MICKAQKSTRSLLREEGGRMCGSCMTCTLESSCLFFPPFCHGPCHDSCCHDARHASFWFIGGRRIVNLLTNHRLLMGLLPPRHDLGSMKSLTGWTTSCLQNCLPSSFCYKRWSFEQQWGSKIHEKSIQENIEETMQKRKTRGWPASSTLGSCRMSVCASGNHHSE